MPEPPRSYDDLVDALKEHPEWRRELSHLLHDEGDPGDGSPPGRKGLPGWLPALGMGALIGAIVAAVVSFALLNDSDEPDEIAALPASPEVERTAVDAATPEETSTVAAATPEESATSAVTSEAAAGSSESSPASPAPQATPTPTAQSAATAAPPTAAATPDDESVAAATPAEPLRYTFAGFEGECAPVNAVVQIENVSQPIVIDALWTNEAGATVISVAPLRIEPVPPGSVVTVKFPTVSPLSPGVYRFMAMVGDTVIASGSTAISC